MADNLLGYARVSTQDQDATLQVQALEAAGCSKVFIDQASGSTTKRPELDKLLAYAREGDTLVVWRLDRLGRSTQHLLRTIEELGQRGVGFRSLTEAISTDSASGALLLTIMSAIAQFELSLVKERTIAGIQAARNRGVRIGRPPKVTLTKIEAAKEMKAAGMSTADIGEALGLSRRSVYRALQVTEPSAQAS